MLNLYSGTGVALTDPVCQVLCFLHLTADEVPSCMCCAARMSTLLTFHQPCYSTLWHVLHCVDEHMSHLLPNIGLVQHPLACTALHIICELCPIVVRQAVRGSVRPPSTLHAAAEDFCTRKRSSTCGLLGDILTTAACTHCCSLFCSVLSMASDQINSRDT